MIISKTSVQSYYDVGIFSAAMSFSNIFFAIAVFGARNFQVSDINHEYSDVQYHTLRIMTCIGAAIICVVSAFILGYRHDILFAIIVFMIYRVFDAYSDLFYGYSQVNGHLEYAGYSMFIKGIMICVLFALLLILTQNLIIAMFSLILSTASLNIFYDQRKAYNHSGLKKMSMKQLIAEFPGIKSLFWACLPLMLNSLIMPLLLAVPRLLIEKIYSAELLGIFTSVTAPTVIISTFVSAAALPLIPSTTKAWQSGKRGKILAYVILPIFLIVCCCIIGIPFILRFGGDILRILYTSAISGYVDLLVIAIITSCILACVILCSNMLISMRKIKAMLSFRLIACIGVFFISGLFIKKWGIYGAAYAIGFAYTFEFILQILFIGYNVFYIKKH